MGGGESTSEIDDSSEHFRQSHKFAAVKLHASQGKTILDNRADGRGSKIEPEGLLVGHFLKGLDLLGHKHFPGSCLDLLDNLRFLAQDLAVRIELHGNAVGEV